MDDFDFGGQRYAIPGGAVDARARRVAHHQRLRAAAALRRPTLDGPCMRCLEPAERSAARSTRARSTSPVGARTCARRTSTSEELDLAAWARDALALGLPAQIVCREDCLGLCAVCGENLNEAGPEHAHEREPDPRWAALRELKLD